MQDSKKIPIFKFDKDRNPNLQNLALYCIRFQMTEHPKEFTISEIREKFAKQISESLQIGN